ncbi:hypothetical protein [Salinispora tropica]|uniref:hypothetical protein n=1 Tax=Salinispora tropica TaxID=168695 RepID=UPI0018B00F01|nr:hypothetical protein [Salinispora tropica]
MEGIPGAHLAVFPLTLLWKISVLVICPELPLRDELMIDGPLLLADVIRVLSGQLYGLEGNCSVDLYVPELPPYWWPGWLSVH